VPAHLPVLLAEALEALAVRPGGLHVDGTVGLGGHAFEVLQRSSPGGRLLGCDRDPEALALCAERLAPFGERARLVQADFRELPRLLGDEHPDGILLDLGVSSLQFDEAERGFSFRADGPLDMRMDPAFGPSAADLVNRLPEHELADIIFKFGEEPGSRRIARSIVEARRRSRIRTTLELAAVVRGAVRHSRPGLDPATRTFQALRIAVNRELEGLEDAVVALAHTLAPGGRLAVISFHSLEDREVKHASRRLAGEGFEVLTRKPLQAGPAELRDNPRARSAKLRALSREAA
jgi:16S rRNA (cytosine1402-N4)-methyltransferase